MRQAMFNPNTQGPDDECFTAGMRDLALQHAPSTSIGSLIAILTMYVSCRTNDITTMIASLGEVESHHQQKAVCTVSQSPVEQQPHEGD